MMLMVRRMTGLWWTAAVALVVAGCAGVGGNAAGVGAGGVATARSSAAASASAGARAAKAATPADAIHRQAKPIWLRSLQMTSAMTGWALYYSGNPSSSPGALLLARTTDGGRSWTDVTPAAARPMLATADATQAVDPVGGDRAYLAVTGATEESNSSVNTTMVFATTDGGRTWIDSAPLRAVSTVSEVSFADLRHGFLLLGGGDGAMGEDSVWLYRTADGGAHWSLAAATTPAPTGTAVSSQPGLGQIPAACDKSGLAFPTATNGWIASTCNAGLADALLVSQDSGVSWADESLPLPATICSAGACTVSGPQFLDRTGFVTVDPEPDGAALLVTRDLGQTWDQLPLPAGLQYPQITFFSPTQGVLVAGETQGAFGGTFYTTADGGRTWTPVPQGANLTRLGVSIDFATPEDGFAWTNGLESDPVPPTSIYETTNSGRSWHAFTPKLAA